jgi:protein-tyrosine phosphatase
MYYTWITPDVAIGELSSSYNEFDTIVNLAYINPSVNRLEHGHIDIVSSNGKKIYRLGVYDSDNDLVLFSELVEKVMDLTMGDKSDRILFHCQAGKSRSVCMALAYLCTDTKHAMTFENALELIKEKRPIVNPRHSFIEAVKRFITLRKASPNVLEI